MARKPQRKAYSSADISQLEIDIRNQETIYKKMTKIAVEPEEDGKDKLSTIGYHDNRTRVPLDSLVLIEDNEAGNIAAPQGCESDPVCRGEALFGNAKKKVALFRKKAS